METLVIISGRQQGQRFTFTQDLIRLGRGRQNDISIDDETASRLHAEVIRRDGKLYARDLGSTNGTFINDKRIEEGELNHGDKLSIGDISLMYRTSESASSKSSVILSSRLDTEPVNRDYAIRLKDTSAVHLPAPVDGAQAQEYFNNLSTFLAEVSGVLNLRRLQDVLLDHVFRALPADRALMMLISEEGPLELVNERMRDGADLPPKLSVSRTLLEHVLEHGESVLSTDASTDEMLKKTVSIKRDRVSSLICCPLKVQDKVLGILYVDTVGASPSFDEQDLRLLTSMAIQASVCIENARLYEQLMNAMEYTSSILRSLSSGLVVCNAAGSIGKINDAACEILGLHETDLLGRDLRVFPNLRPLHRLIDQTLQSGKNIPRAEVVITVGTDEVPLGLNTSIIENHLGEVVGVILIFRNLSQIRELEEQVHVSQHLAAIGEMAAGVAHEIRNPLNSIRGFAQILLEQKLDPPKDEYLKIIVEEVDRMNGLVQDMLDYARPKPLTLHQVQVNAVVREIMAECKPELDEANVVAELKLDESLPSVTGNANRFKQVLLNIIRNARQAMEEGGNQRRELTVTTASKVGEDGGWVVVSIEDTGPGIAPEVIGKIFDPFVTKKDVGTGLGLAICRKIMDQHNGRIEAESEPGEGCCFRLMLPMPHEVRLPEPIQAPAPQAGSAGADDAGADGADAGGE